MYRQWNPNRTPQSEQAREDQQLNNAGGYAFTLSEWDQLGRFLVIGTESGTFYVSPRELTAQNAKNVLACIKEDGKQVVDRAVEISQAGRAPRNTEALFVLALAVAYGDAETKAYALDNLQKVARIGTHILQFVDYVNTHAKWNRSLRRAVGNWYLDKSPKALSYQVLKYQNRYGWSHGDVLRLAHPKPRNIDQDMIFQWVVGKANWDGGTPLSMEQIVAFDEAKTASPERLCALIREHRMTREMVPTQALNNPDVWAALLPHMPIGAMIRNLGKMTKVGLLRPLSSEAKHVSSQLVNEERLRKARVHPLAVLNAMKVYAQGHGVRGSLSWSPVRNIVDGLDTAFYLSFGAVEPAGKRTMLALDVSYSMSQEFGNSVISCAEATAAMSLITASTEPEYLITAFCDTIMPLPISPRQRLDDAMKHTRDRNWGGTDCALPMMYALERRLPVDTFVVYTDNETWAGNIHPFQALRQYRDKMGIDAKLVVVGMTATEFTIADPRDAGMLDVVGFDTATPNLISTFSRGL